MLIPGLIFALSAGLLIACGSDSANSDASGGEGASDTTSENGENNPNANDETDENAAAEGDESLPPDIGEPLPAGEHTIVFPDIPKNSLSFVSNAEEVIKGTVVYAGDAEEVHGSITVSATKGSASAGSLSFPIADLRTGNTTRDEHMRSEGWLNAGAYPNVKITGISAEKIEGTDTLWRLTGTFEMHGEGREITIPINVRHYDSFPNLPQNEDGYVRVSGGFDVPLKEHGVNHQAVGSPAVAEVWEVDFTLWGVVNPQQ